MRCYKVTATAAEGETLGFRYGTTQANAKEVREELMVQFEIKKGQVTIEEADIPTAKADLLAFINDVAASGDATLGDGEDD